jgi:AmmeMemoRadiSam system protein B
MQKKIVNALFFLCLSGCTLLWYRNVQLEKKTVENHPAVLGARTPSDVVHKNFDYNWDLYNEGIAAVTAHPPQQLSGKITGAVIPHHLLQSHYIADMYARFKAQGTVKTVIIIGPNHPEVGAYWALTSAGSWDTPDGIVEADTQKISALEKAGVLREDTKTVEIEHSINSQIPFIAHYLPGVRVVPIVMSAFSSQEQITALVTALKPLVGEDTVVVASVDFSHYLDRATAEKMDAETKELLEKKNYGKILSLANNANHMDSPTSIVTLMQTMDAVGASSMQVLANTNSGVLLQDDSVPTTSYFEIAFIR